MYVYLQIKISLRNTNIPLRYSMVSSSTRLSSLSKPWRMPSTSRPPCNLTRTFWSKYFVKSTTASFSPLDIFERLSQYVSRKAIQFFSQLLFEMSFISCLRRLSREPSESQLKTPRCICICLGVSSGLPSATSIHTSWVRMSLFLHAELTTPFRHRIIPIITKKFSGPLALFCSLDLLVISIFN